MDSTAVFVSVTEYGNLFPTLTFFLDGLHLTFGYKLIVGTEATDIMQAIGDLFPFV